MRRCFYIVTTLLLAACGTKQQEKQPAVLYDPATIGQFAIATAATDSLNAVRLTDSLLLPAAKDSATFRNVTAYLTNYFGNPNSPYRNEALLIHVVKANIKSPWYSNTEKEAARKQLYLLMQNRPGTDANDFTYTGPAGFKKRMNDIHAPFTILYFYNPECDACKEMRTALVNSELINSKIKTGQLKVLAMYTDADEKTWLDHLSEMPESWIQGRDVDEYLYKNSVYNLKAIPTVYLLDKDKRVLLKDCMDVQLIEKYLK